jgi:malonyl-CoA O-methyltransferase
VNDAQDPRSAFALDRRDVARAFDRASDSYDAAAALQERVRNGLLERLDELPLAPTAILDLGAGTGHATRALKRRYPKSLVVATDIAPGMLDRAKAQSRWLRRFERVCADACRLPFRDGSFDLVFTSLMLQWCDDLDAVSREISRVLKPGGLLLASTFGPGTLQELRESWLESGAPGNHVNHFFDAHDVGMAFMHAGFAEPVLDIDRVVIGYDDVFALMRELKSIGAHNVTRGRARGLTGRARLAAMTRAYETRRRDAKLPATWEIIHAVAWGGAPRRDDLPGEVLIAPDAIRRSPSGRR